MITFLISFLLFPSVLICADIYHENYEKIYKIFNNTQLRCNSTTSGYKCTSCNFNHTVCRNHSDRICPNDWGCIDLHNGFLCRPHDFIHFGRQHRPLTAYWSPTRKKRHESLGCSKMLCQNGAICKKDKCECLRHFKGKYCNDMVNYCQDNPCKRNAACISRVGGFTCECDDRLAGKYCELNVRNVIHNMKYPDFLYAPLQYARYEYYYIFRSKVMGVLPEARVDFGDGTILIKRDLLMNINHTFYASLKYFQLSPNMSSEKSQIYMFKHAYKKPRVYIIRMRAWNRLQEVYNTEYEVQVISALRCSLTVAFRNAPVQSDEAFRLYREHTVYFMSSAWSNCMQTEYEYQWELHKVETFDDELTRTNSYHTEDEIDLRKSYLYIPSYYLDYGNYTVALTVKMVKPMHGITSTVYTWFMILRRPIISHIQGGRIVWMNPDSVFYVDASMSYDPNYTKKDQPPLIFSWTCHPHSKFCQGYALLNETSSVLIVPPHGFEEQKYTIQVWVNHAAGSNVTHYTGTSTQVVHATRSQVPFFYISCIQNCIGGFSNALYVIALRGICVSKPREEVQNKIFWTVYSNPEENAGKGMRLDNSEFSEDNYYLIMYEQQLKHQTPFKIVFSGYSMVISSVGNRNASYAEFYLTTYTEPESTDCTIFPLEGYSMLTSFTIVCSTSGSNETAAFEAVQFFDLEDRANNGIMVAYDSTGTMENITLAPGLRRDDYVTTVRISQILYTGVHTDVERNVTVFPLIYLLKEPSEVILRLFHVGTGLGSPLHVLFSGGNYVEVVQQIISVSYSLEDFLRSKDWIAIEKIGDYHIEQVRDNLINYLHEIPIGNLQSLKHLCSALYRVINLPSERKRWRATINMSMNILQRIISNLEDRFHEYFEPVFQNDMDDIGILFLDMASNILYNPTTEYYFGDESGIDPEQISPFVANEQTSYYEKLLNEMLNIIDRFMELYMTDKVPNERTSLITSSKLSILIKKAAPESMTLRSLSLSEKIAINLSFDTTMYNKHAYLEFKAIIIEDCAQSVQQGRQSSMQISSFSFPFVKMGLKNVVDKSPVDADLEIYIRPVHSLNMDVIHGYVPVRLFWQIEEKHIQVHRLILPKGGKLLINFMPIQDNNKLKVVVTKSHRPRLLDFWYNGIDIPQKVIDNSRDQGLSVFIDDEAKYDKTFYYLGILPHRDSLKELMRDIEEPILPRAFNYDDEEYNGQNDHIDENFYDETTTDDIKYRDMPHVDYLVYNNDSSDTDYNNRKLPYSFTAHSVRCITWNETNEYGKSQCEVKETTTFSRVVCQCKGYQPVTATFENVSVRYQRQTAMHYFIKYIDNPLIPFLLIFTSILFIGLFKWAASEDFQDRKRRTVTFLVDNYPQCEYCYLVIVQTGRRLKAETTSNVTIELEGTQATSLPHVLKDWTRAVFLSGTQDFFVLKTIKPLGDIYCLHIWTDYSGARPSWYCSKIIIQDVQEQQVWFFIVDKWFEPISGDGTMSYTIYRSPDEQIFSFRYQLKESIARKFNSGMHGWLSIFYKHPYSTYTRKQRVAVAYTHMVIIMILLILQNELPAADKAYYQIYPNGSFKWENRDLLLAAKSVFAAVPFHCLLVWLFSCIKPSSQWSESRVDRNLERFNIKSTESILWITVGSKNVPPQSNIKVSRRPKPLGKKVSFYSDFYEPQAEERHLMSRFDMEKLEEKAGKDKVVPLRTPTSKMETETPVSESETTLSEVLSSSVFGQEIISQSYCFPPACLYVGWIILVLIIIPCVYVVLFYGVSYGWVLSLHFLISFSLAVTISVFVTEPLKLILISVVVFLYARREYTIEDRSDLVNTLNRDFTVAPHMRHHITEKLNSLRKLPMYMPLTEEQVTKFKRNRVVTFLTKVIIADFMLLIFFVLLLFTMCYMVFSTFGYYHHQNVKRLFEKVDASEKNTLTDVNVYQDLVYYLEHTIIANLYLHDTEGTNELYPVRDDVNYLIGVVQLRQIRKSPYACHERGNRVQKWASRCGVKLDNKNYSEGWKSLEKQAMRKHGNQKEAWLHKSSMLRFKARYTCFNETRYPASYYTALLGRTKKDSLEKLQYLSKNKWIDFLTKVIFIDFSLYNPHMHYLTLVTLMAERTTQGVYYIHDTIAVIQMHPVELYAYLYLIIFLLIIFTWLMIYVHNESKKYSLLKPKQTFSKKWNTMKKSLLVLGVINMIFYTNKVLFLDYYNEQISISARNGYVDFRTVALWDKVLAILISFMLFLVILDLCKILQTFYRVNLAWSVISKSVRPACQFLIFIIIIVSALSWCGYFLYGPHSYHFHTFRNSFFTIFSFLRREFKTSKFGSLSELWIITFLYYLTTFALLLFVFRWLTSVLMIHLYSAIKRNARLELYQSVLSSYTKKHFDTLSYHPNRKPLKLTVYLQKVGPKLQAMGYLFSYFYESKRGQESNKEEIENLRLQAMNVITTSILKEVYKPSKHYCDDIHKYQREEQAKALTRLIIITNGFKNKLEYLNVKIDRLIRTERYKSLLIKK